MMPARAGRSHASQLREPRITDTAAGQTHVGRDLLALLGVLVFAAGLTLLIDRTGQFSARLGFAGAAGVVASCMTAWRRLRQPGPRRWRSGQVIYHGRRVTLVSSWGVEGQPPPAIESLAAAEDSDELTGPAVLPATVLPLDSED